MPEQHFDESTAMPQPVVKDRASTPRLVWLILVLAIVSAGAWGVIKYTKQPVSPAQDQRPIFSIDTQFVPDGATSLRVDEVLAVFNFVEPLPFFEERNVVQSLDAGTNAPATTSVSSRAISRTATSPRMPPQYTPTTFLSYRIFGQNKDAIRNAFMEYFRIMGWKMADAKEGKPLVFSSEAHQIVSITFLDVPTVPGTNQPTVVAALTIR